MEEIKTEDLKKEESPQTKIKTREGSGYLKQLYTTARVTAGSTHSHLRNLTTFLVNFVPVEKVDASELQVRVHFDESEIATLSASIKEHGVLQPILIVQNGERYKVIAGERRLRAARLAGLERIPARVLSTNDKATHEIALRENLDRVDLHPIEEGEGYASLLEAKAYASHDAIAQAFGKSKSRITECIAFARLPAETKNELLKSGMKNRALLRNLLNTTPEKQIQIIHDALGKEEVLGTPGTLETEKNSKALPSTQNTKKSFHFQVDAKGVSVPSFKWKKTENPQVLQDYIQALQKLLKDLKNLK